MTDLRPQRRVAARREYSESAAAERVTVEGVRVDLYEYQAKHLFGKHGVPVTAGEVCTTA